MRSLMNSESRGMNTDSVRRELIAGSEHRLRRIEQLVSLAEEQQILILGRRHAEFQESLERQDALLMDLSESESREQSLIAKLMQTGENAGRSKVFRSEYRQMNRRIRDAAAQLEARLARNSETLGIMIERTEGAVSTVSLLLGEQTHSFRAAA